MNPCLLRWALVFGFLVGHAVLTSYATLLEQPQIGDPVSLPSGKNVTLYYHVEEFDQHQRGMRPIAFVNDVAVALAEAPLFSSVVNTTPLPGKGTYLLVKGEKISPSWLASVFYDLSFLTLYIIPSYDSGSGFLIRYELYQDGAFKKRADYKFVMRSFYWIGLFPMVMVRQDSMKAPSIITEITRDFLQNSYADGYFE